jgi:hypothetical protein
VERSGTSRSKHERIKIKMLRSNKCEVVEHKKSAWGAWEGETGV